MGDKLNPAPKESGGIVSTVKLLVFRKLLVKIKLMTYAFCESRFPVKAALIINVLGCFIAESHNIHAKTDKEEQGQRCQRP